ncbi:MAG: VWA domain-containing protein [Acidobacteriaceae bacterium]
MHDRCRTWVWITGVVLLVGSMSLGVRAAAQTPADEGTAAPTEVSQSAVIQKRTMAPLTQDSDPVASPDAQSVPPGPGQYPSQAGVITKENGRYTLVSNAYEVRLNASVFDSGGQEVNSLPESAFKVYEDGVLQKIVGFRHEDLPISLGILIDSSGSMYDKRPSVDAAALNLVKLSNPKDEAFLVDFNSEPYIDQDFTSSIAKLQQGLSYIKAGGGTALYDAVIAAADYLSKNAKQPKQVILIVTDGDDNSSNATLDETIRRVQALDGPSIYCIGLLFGGDLDHKDVKHSKEVLTQLADDTGGEAYFPKKLADVDGIAQQVAQAIRSQYMIEYHSTKPMSVGGYRTIHVDADGKGYHGLRVRTRAGYFPKVGAQSTQTGAGQQ